MNYSNIVRAEFVSRPNRFIAYVDIDGKREKVHVKNTGRCRELLIPGVEVILEHSDNPERKTAYDLIAVYKEGLGLINIDSQAPNRVVGEWLAEKGLELIKPEYTYGSSRIDFYMEEEGKRILMEVKGCTLEREKVGYFPDAPTERGVKHLNELKRAAKEGYLAYVAFVIQMEGIREVRPNIETHAAFGEALREAKEAGVHEILLPCTVREDRLEIDEKELRRINSGEDFIIKR